MVPEGGREADPMRSLLILTTLAVMLAGSRGSFAANFDEDTFGRKSIPAYSIPTPERGAPPAETVIGQAARQMPSSNLRPPSTSSSVSA